VGVMSMAGTKTATMSPTDAFFAELARRGHEPRLARVHGSVRFDLETSHGTERWLVCLVLGDITVSHRRAKADAILRTEKSLFDGFVTGRANPFAATLRGLVGLEGDPELFVLFRRLLWDRRP
jgi:putative sterol carrier protein